MRRNTSYSFTNVLAILRKKGIRTQAALRADPQLCDLFFTTSREFALRALASKSSTKKKDKSRQLSGNRAKVAFLEANSSLTRDDLADDCVVQMINYADRILQMDTLEHASNYAYTIVNTVVNTACRSLPLGKEVSLYEPIPGSHPDDEGEPLTYEKIASARNSRYNPEDIYFACVTVQEKREQLLKEIRQLSRHPEEAFCRLGCVWLGMRPRDLSTLLLDRGCSRAFAQVLFEVEKKYGIPGDQIHAALADARLDASRFRLESGDAREVAHQISRLTYRAREHCA